MAKKTKPETLKTRLSEPTENPVDVPPMASSDATTPQDTTADEAQPGGAASASELPGGDALPGSPGDSDSAVEPAADQAAASSAAADVGGDIEPAAEALPVTMETLLTAAAVDGGDGYRQRTPKPRLSAEEATIQRKLFNALAAAGVPVKDQGGVYPWLLRQIGTALSN